MGVWVDVWGRRWGPGSAESACTFAPALGYWTISGRRMTAGDKTSGVSRIWGRAGGKTGTLGVYSSPC
eukprot:357008-Chlamydomonas_euryale.AAC.6